MRIKILRVLIAAMFCLVLGSLFYYQAIKGKFYYRLSTQNRIRVIPLEGSRGRIYDRNGTVLADNRMSYTAAVIPQEIENQEELFGFIAGILKKDPQVLRRRFLARKFTPFSPVVLYEDLSKEEAIRLQENRYRFPALLVQESYRRHYPLGKNSAHVLGYVGMTSEGEMELLKEYGYSPRSVIGKTGVEKFYDHYLKGSDGGTQVEVDSRGQQVRLLGFKKPVQGEDITLTIDAGLQAKALELLEGRVGAIVMMDVYTGEVLAMASSPAYDPNIFVDDNRNREVSQALADKDAPVLNRAVKGAYPPGSVFKIAGAIAALATKKITEHTGFDCPGQYMLGRQRFGCTHVHGHQNLVDAIAHSCNVYFYNVGLLLGPDVLFEYAQKLGLGKETHIDLPFENAGNIPSRQKLSKTKNIKWYGGNTLNMSIGQGDILTTPLQLARMMATVFLKGKEVQPHLLKGVGGSPVKMYDFYRQLDIPQKYFEIVTKGMRATVENYSGTAHILDLPGMEVMGKTGTAQSSGEKEEHAWFAGVVKGPGRQMAFCVFLEHGGSSYNANLVARQLLTHMKTENLL